MPDAARFAHSTSGDDDVKAMQPVERHALLDRFGEAHLARSQGDEEFGATLELPGVPGKDLCGLFGKR